MEVKIKNTKHTIVAYIGDEVLATVNRNLLNILINPPKKVKPKSELENKIKFLIKAYIAEWEKYYSTKFRTEYRQGTKDWSHFKKAAEICIAHNAKASTFIKAQIEGLKFVNGTGVFPKPNQLASTAAETRLMDYVKDDLIDEKPILTWEKETNLEKNKNYLLVKEKIKNNTATLKEAKYAYECEVARRGSASITTRAYLKVMEENAKKDKGNIR